MEYQQPVWKSILAKVYTNEVVFYHKTCSCRNVHKFIFANGGEGGRMEVDMKKIFNISYVFLIFNFIFLILAPADLRAQVMKSENFFLQGGNFNMTSGNKSSQNFRLSDVVGQTAAGLFTSKGYIINAGFLNQAAGAFFTFTVSPATIDFGTLTPNTPVEKQILISIANGDVPGYNVKMSENQPLGTTVGAEIPDTACDGGTGDPCTKAQASLWTGNGAYGFGYRIEGKTVPVDFEKEGYYRPFPATRRNEPQALIMESKARKVADTATMTVRVNVSPNQPVGQYRNVLSFTALAGI